MWTLLFFSSTITNFKFIKKTYLSLAIPAHKITQSINILLINLFFLNSTSFTISRLICKLLIKIAINKLNSLFWIFISKPISFIIFILLRFWEIIYNAIISKESFYLRNDKIKFKTRNVLMMKIYKFMRKITKIKETRLLKTR